MHRLHLGRTPCSVLPPFQWSCSSEDCVCVQVLTQHCDGCQWHRHGLGCPHVGLAAGGHRRKLSQWPLLRRVWRPLSCGAPCTLVHSERLRCLSAGSRPPGRAGWDACLCCTTHVRIMLARVGHFTRPWPCRLHPVLALCRGMRSPTHSGSSAVAAAPHKAA